MIENVARERKRIGGHFEQVGRAEPINYRLHATGIIQITFAFKLTDFSGSAHQSYQVTSRRCTPDRDASRVEIILSRVRAEPSDGCLAIFNLSGKLRLLT